ncbi:TVP38/TMEM64 family protein [Brevundimonas sp. UBA5866]|nr:VTT domain-containing protein [Brevundimonas sp. UBA5866]
MQNTSGARFIEALARRWPAIVAGLMVLLGTTVLFAVGKQHFVESQDDVARWLAGYRAGPWGAVVASILFTAAALAGAPQFLLIGICVLVFGPWHGFAYSWVATIVSAGVTYWLGRGPAARWLDRFGNTGFERVRAFIGQNAFAASFVIRNVPSAPFVVVNAAFGAVRANFWGYLAGCALGSLPKTAVIAFFGGSFVTAVKGDGIWSSAILAGIALVWLLIMLVTKRWIQSRLRLPQD